MSERIVPVVYGSVRRDRVGIRLARYVVAELARRGYRPVLVDPAERPLPLLDRMFKEYAPGDAPPVMAELAKLFASADGFVVVCGEYNWSIPPALSNLLDHFLEEFFWRPAAIACYAAGSFGGMRAAVQMRSMLGEMGMVTIPTMQPFPHVGEAFADDGAPTDAKTRERTARFFDEFGWYVDALAAQRAGGVLY